MKIQSRNPEIRDIWNIWDGSGWNMRQIFKELYTKHQKKSTSSKCLENVLRRRGCSAHGRTTVRDGYSPQRPTWDDFGPVICECFPNPRKSGVLGFKRIVRAFQNIQNFWRSELYSSSYLDFSAAPPKFLNQLTDSFVKSLLLAPSAATASVLDGDEQ